MSKIRMKALNKRQRPSVKRLKRRRIKLDSIEQEIVDQGVALLTKKKRDFYQNQLNYNNQDRFRQIKEQIKDEGYDSLSEEDRTIWDNNKIRSRVITHMSLPCFDPNDFSPREHAMYEDVKFFNEIRDEIYRFGRKKVSEEDVEFYESSNRRKPCS